MLLYGSKKIYFFIQISWDFPTLRPNIVQKRQNFIEGVPCVIGLGRGNPNDLGQTGECKTNVARQIQMDGREPKNIAKFALPIVLEDPHGRVQGK